MLNKVIDRILFDDDGKVIGVESDGEVAATYSYVLCVAFVSFTARVFHRMCLSDCALSEADSRPDVPRQHQQSGAGATSCPQRMHPKPPYSQHD